MGNTPTHENNCISLVDSVFISQRRASMTCNEMKDDEVNNTLILRENCSFLSYDKRNDCDTILDITLSIYRTAQLKPGGSLW